MADVNEIRDVLKVLREFYGDTKNGPWKLNDAQNAMYFSELAAFTKDQLTIAARAHMAESAFFPKLSELLKIIKPPKSLDADVSLAWTTLERAIRRAGIYRGVTFADGQLGATVVQVFGSWAAACNYDWDGPGWAIRRQMFKDIFPTNRGKLEPVTLRGIGAGDPPLLIGELPTDALPAHDARDRAKDVLKDIQRRFLDRGGAA